MIDLLGKKIVALIIICLLSTVGAGCGVYYYVFPQQEKLDKESKSLKSKIDAKRGEIKQITFEFEKIQSQIVEYNLLKGKGFFNAQDRITARDAAVAVIRNARLLDNGTELDFKPASIVANQDSEKAGYKLLSGPVSIRVSALSDTHVFLFMRLLDGAFPGYMQMKSFKITRNAGSFLERTQRLREGTAEPMVTGTAEFVWWSMASEAQLKSRPELNPALSQTEPSEGEGGPVTP